MSTFIISSLAAWLGLLLYVGWLGSRQQKLQRTLDELSRQSERLDSTRQTPTKAA